MTWDVKGNLTSVKNRNGKSAEYTYLSDGQRYTKTTGGKKTTYLYNNGLLLSETTGNEVINYYYDSDGTILGIGYKKGSNPEKHYFFEKNAFGDVIAVYRNSDSVLIGTYEYDLWGNPVSVNEAASGRDTDGILQKNPFRYRCYYYDTETGFYYLNSRYYDPQTRRFISADSMVTNTGTDVFGYNLYSYCNNSPLNRTDSNGHMSKLSMIFKTISIIAFVVALAAATVASGGGAGLAFAGCAISGGTAAAVAGEVAIGAASVGIVFAVGSIHQDVTDALSNSELNKNNQQKSNHESSTGNWNKGSFDSAEDSLNYHYKIHGKEVGATSQEQYLRKAEEFAKTAKKGSVKSKVKGAVEGVIRYKKNGKFIDIAPDGSIISFGNQ